MKITSQSCADFVAVLATKAPVPGGGGASALCGAIGTALGNMVGSLTVGKKKYAAVEEEIKEYQSRCDALQKDFLALVEKDAEVFAPLAAAYGMPKDTEEQRAEKDRVMESALKAASEAPLQIMRKCGEAIELLEQFAAKGSKIAVSDAGVGAALCKAALQGAALNVYINTRMMKDTKRAAETNSQADALLQKYGALADKIYSSVSGRLHPGAEA
ncbi:MAG: cyclodeaminase/cyclohydrolase family protein [Pyramidobacter sp.]|jgi:formiminotetrahydrofolate cyclodeaminase